MQSENGEDGEGEEEGNEGDDEATKEEHSFIPTFSLYIIPIEKIVWWLVPKDLTKSISFLF